MGGGEWIGKDGVRRLQVKERRIRIYTKVLPFAFRVPFKRDSHSSFLLSAGPGGRQLAICHLHLIHPYASSRREVEAIFLIHKQKAEPFDTYQRQVARDGIGPNVVLLMSMLRPG